MPVGAATPGIGPIDVNQLVGRADPSIVEPRNVAMLTDAFRQGVISADDIVARVGELGKTKQKAELQQAQEFTSPEAQAARAQAMSAQTEQAQLAEMQAQRAQVLQQYPAVAYFDKFAPAAGIQAPTLPDGSPDYKKMEKIGAELALHQAQKSDAAAQLENITTQESADGSVLFARTKQGEFVAPETVAKLRAQATRSFMSGAPGTVETLQVTPKAAPAAAAAPVSSEPIDAVRARLADKFGVEAVINLPDEDLWRLDANEMTSAPAPAAAAVQVEPRTAPAKASSVGAPVPGGISLGSTGPARQGMASEQQKALAQASLTKEQLKSVSDSFARLQTDAPWLTGPVMGRLTAFTAPQNWNVARADFDRATTAILANLAKGIYHETGVLSDQDIKRYQKALPGPNDTADVARVKLEGVTRDIFNSIDTNIESLKGQGQSLTPIVQAMQDTARAELQKLSQPGQSASAPAASGRVITLPSGKRVQRDANGVFVEVQ